MSGPFRGDFLDSHCRLHVCRCVNSCTVTVKWFYTINLLLCDVYTVQFVYTLFTVSVNAFSFYVGLAYIPLL